MQDPFRLIVWRESVCAGDDGNAPHELALDVPRNLSLRDLVQTCFTSRYLASISGGKATWVLASTHPLAVIAQQWDEPKFLVAPDSPLLALIDPAARPHLGFKYRCQTDPEQVFDRLLRGESPSAA